MAVLAGADLRRGVVDIFVAGRGGLKAVALRLGADFEDSGIIRQFNISCDVVRPARRRVAFLMT